MEKPISLRRIVSVNTVLSETYQAQLLKPECNSKRWNQYSHFGLPISYSSISVSQKANRVCLFIHNKVVTNTSTQFNGEENNLFLHSYNPATSILIIKYYYL
jgi:hypothetical protein